jgi:hypothetical protein
MKKTRKPDSRDGWYLLAPGDAQRLIDAQPTNRPMRLSKSERFAKDITSGKWRPNGEPLILDEQDLLADGQGRCRAVVLAGRPIEVYVIHGIPRKFFPTFDTGQARTGADTLSINGVKHYAVVSAVAKIGITLAAGGSGANINKPATNQDIEAFSKKNAARIDAAVEKLHRVWIKSPLAPSILTYVYMAAAEIDDEKALRWALGVALGENLPAGSPMLTLRNRLIGLKGEQHRAKNYEKLAWAIKSWNAFAAGRAWHIARWTARLGGKNAEAFPVISDGAEE